MRPPRPPRSPPHTCPRLQPPFLAAISAFTLIELLVVLAVTAILATLLFGSVRNSLDKAATAKSINNLRSITQATLVYAADHDDYFPPYLAEAVDGTLDHGIIFFNELRPYLELVDSSTESFKKIWWDPKAPKTQPSWILSNYGINTVLAGVTVAAGAPENPNRLSRRKLVSIEHPTKQALFASIRSNYFVFPWLAYTWSEASPGNQLSNWHSGGTVISFADGHILTGVVIPPGDEKNRWFSFNDPLAP